MNATETRTHTGRTAPHAGIPRRAHRAVSYCSIWDLVAPGEACPACEDTYEDRLARARGGRR